MHALWLLAFAAGTAAIVWGAEAFAGYLGQASIQLGVSSFALALLLAGAEPEKLATSVVAALRGSLGIALGDVIGANVTICLVALGVGAWREWNRVGGNQAATFRWPALRRPSITAARTCRTRCAPRGDQRICCRLFMRALTRLFTTDSAPEAPPIRPERHVANSITSLRIVIARAISRILPRCPCCQRTMRRATL
jgi:hypothetical protein